MATQINNRTYNRGSGSALVISPAWQFIYGNVRLNMRDQLERFHVDDLGGFEDADLRLAAEELPQQEGEQALPSFYGGRTMTISGKIKAGNLDRLDDMEQALREELLSLEEKPLIMFRPRPAVVQSNLMMNPSAEISTNYMLGYSASLSRTDSVSVSGDWSFVITKMHGNEIWLGGKTDWSAPSVVPGVEYSSFAFVRALGTTMRNTEMGIDWVDDAGNIVGVNYSGRVTRTYPNDWVAPYLSAIAPVGAVRARPFVNVWSANVGESFAVDAFLFTEGDVPLNYRGEINYSDGDTIGYEWEGTPHLSRSNKRLPPEVQINCRKADKLSVAKQITKDNVFERPFQIALRASDPRYESTDTQSVSITPNVINRLGRSYNQGYDRAYDQPMDSQYNLVASGSSNSVVLNNRGNWDGLPIIRFTGPMTGLVLRNESNGRVIRFKGDVSTGEVLTMDTKQGTIIDQNGENRFSILDETSDWMRVGPGDNIFVLSVATFAIGASVEIEYRDTWM